MENVKTCVTCKHMRQAGWRRKCAVVVDPVTGGAGAFCDIEREGSGLRTGCGVDGRKWEPQPRRWWQFWRSYG